MQYELCILFYAHGLLVSIFKIGGNFNITFNFVKI